MDLSLVYREEIMDHIKNPKNVGIISNYTSKVTVLNTNCGDKITLYINTDSGIISDIKYVSDGCAISTASASIISEKLKGKPVSDIECLSEQDILDNFYNNLTPARKKCALLIYSGLKKVLKQNATKKNKKI